MNRMSERVSFEDMVRAGVNIVTGDEYRKTFITVAKIAAEILAKTLGPYAHTTVIDDGVNIYSTKDGWNIVNRLQFRDALQNADYGMIKDVSYHLVTSVGDGTTTAIVASNAMIQKMSSPEYCDLMQKYRQRDVLKSMNRVKEKIQERLESTKYLHLVSSKNNFEDIYKIAMVSSNENEEVSSIIRKIYCETNNPNIHVNLGNTRSIDYEIQIGYRLDSKPMNINAYINSEGSVYKEKNALTFFFNHNVTYVEHAEIISALIELANMKNTVVFVFAPYFDDVISGMFHQQVNTLSRNGQIPNILPIQVPMTRQIQKDYFEDAAMITKSEIFGPEQLKEVMDMTHPKDDKGLPVNIDEMEKIRMHNRLQSMLEKFFGIAMSTIVTSEYVLFEEFDREFPLYKNTLTELRSIYENIQAKAAKDMNSLNKEFMDVSMRYTRLSGAMGIINIGAGSELEQRCLKDSVDDAVLACRSAYINGYVIGMNLATIGAALDTSADEDLDEMDHRIAKLIADVFREVTFEVMKNKYPDSDPTQSRVWSIGDQEKESADHVINICLRDNIGYDIVTEKFFSDDPIVINSVKTDIEIISAMMSIVTHALTSNQMLSVNRTYDKEIGKQLNEEITKEKYGLIAKAILDVINETGISLKSYEPASCNTLPDLTVPDVLVTANTSETSFI